MVNERLFTRIPETLGVREGEDLTEGGEDETVGISEVTSKIMEEKENLTKIMVQNKGLTAVLLKRERQTREGEDILVLHRETSGIIQTALVTLRMREEGESTTHMIATMILEDHVGEDEATSDNVEGEEEE